MRAVFLRTLPWLALIASASLWAAWSTLDRYFIGDDFAYVQRFSELPWAEWPLLFIREWSGGMWGTALPELRPFAAFTFMLDASVWGTNPLGYHLTNLFLAIGAAWCVAAVVWLVQDRVSVAGAIAGILFSLHPTHAEPLAWITGRVDILATFFLIGGFAAALWQLKQPSVSGYALSVGAYAAGAFSKEFSLVLPVLVAAFACVWHNHLPTGLLKRLSTLLLGYALALLVYAWCRHLAFPDGLSGRSEPLVWGAVFERQVSYLGWLFPFALNEVRETYTHWLPHAGKIWLGGLLVMTGLLMTWRWLCGTGQVWRAWLFFGLAWYLIAVLPLIVVMYFSPRHLFYASAGTCIAWALSWPNSKRGRWIYGVITCALIISFGSLFAREVRPWRLAAKVSERIHHQLRAESGGPEEVWLLDVPATYLGAWMWAWATPFSLQPPFRDEPRAMILETPDVYFQPGAWAARPAIANVQRAQSVVLISVDARGQPTRRAIPLTRFQPALARFRSELQTMEATQAWRNLITSLEMR